MCRSAFAAAATVISTPTRHSTSGRALRAQTMRRWPFARCGSCMNGSWHMVWWSRLHPPFSSAGARRRCYLPAIWWRCWTPCARYGAFVRMPRSQPRRNPDSVDPGYLRLLRDGGFTRISFGMQSSVPHVLRTLDRTHNPSNVAADVEAAHRLGLETSVDLIYGAPGESIEDWCDSVRSAIDLGVHHISAYALTVEPHTKMADASPPVRSRLRMMMTRPPNMSLPTSC